MKRALRRAKASRRSVSSALRSRTTSSEVFIGTIVRAPGSGQTISQAPQLTQNGILMVSLPRSSMSIACVVQVFLQSPQTVHLLESQIGASSFTYGARSGSCWRAPMTRRRSCVSMDCLISVVRRPITSSSCVWSLSRERACELMRSAIALAPARIGVEADTRRSAPFIALEIN